MYICIVVPGRLIGSHPSGEQAFDDAGDDGKVIEKTLRVTEVTSNEQQIQNEWKTA